MRNLGIYTADATHQFLAFRDFLNMSMTYDDALETLCSMFQSWDRETIIATFQSNGCNVERTIETLLSSDNAQMRAKMLAAVKNNDFKQLQLLLTSRPSWEELDVVVISFSCEFYTIYYNSKLALHPYF